MRILLVEDDMRTASFIVKGLRQEGFAVDHAHGGRIEVARSLPQGTRFTLGLPRHSGK